MSTTENQTTMLIWDRLVIEDLYWKSHYKTLATKTEQNRYRLLNYAKGVP